MTKEQVKDKVAQEKGYPNWKEMYDFVARDGQIPAVVAQLIEAATEEAMEQYVNERSLEIAGEAFDAGKDYAAYLLNGRHGVYPDHKTFLSNLKKKLDDKA